MSVIFSQLLEAMASGGNRLDPIPTHVAPASNQAFRFASSGLTPPVTITCDHGIGALSALTKPGPSTSPGKTLQISQPNSCAYPTSDTDPQPGI